MKILTAEQMRQVEEDCAKIGISSSVLMENAGRAVAGEVQKIMGTAGGQRVLLLIGPGNNGGDGLVVARYLYDWGVSVNLYLLGPRPPEDPNFKLVQERGITFIDVAQDENLQQLNELLLSVGVVVDALFGTGKSRSLSGSCKQALEAVDRAKKKRPELCIVALDLPSGLDTDSGAVDPACLYADHTITLGFPKRGLFNSPGKERAGQLTVVDIGIPPYLAETASSELLSADWARSVLPPRPPEANKGSFGRALVVAGSINYIGAAALAASGAMRVGAGLVTLATPVSLQPVLAAQLTEATYLPLPQSHPGIVSPAAAGVLHRRLNQYDALLLGCGLGQSQPVVKFVGVALLKKGLLLPPLVLDADALNILAGIPDWWQRLGGDAILTPHPGEMARLARIPVEGIQNDRQGIARKLAREWQKTIVLKGAYTVIAAPDGQCWVSAAANPGLASAGTGDVLSGIIAGLLAQGLSLSDAAALGVYLHAEAGELVKSQLGDAGMIATDLLPVLPRVIKQLKES